MRVFRGIPARADRALALTIGNFDGVHLGHQAMLARLIEAAARLGAPAAVMTFEPQPQEFFAPDQAPARLTSLREKLELLRSHGVERTYVFRFDYRFAQLSPRDFIERVLVRGLGVRWLLVGDDFRFGARRAGDFAMLKALGAEHGFEVEAMHSVVRGGERVSSTAVRARLEAGDLAGAQALLGRQYAISGRVVRGDSLGSRLGYPTANVQLRRLRPALAGIFVVEVDCLEERPLPGVASVGVRPTVKQRGEPTLEVHLFDFERRIYGRRICVRFLQKLRDEQKYATLDELTAQIARDVAVAKQFFRFKGTEAHRSVGKN
ncbi:MAG TPA: bifunctional riboflavin kinase/FAD synthetase [Burkholderiales bacterium]|jgi:riboflavin kinase/FMN adenylyltransferase|nr:bifunctional riboflavin kinase/FAD synthetase [Burkholderiales bacterium]